MAARYFGHSQPNWGGSDIVYTAFGERKEAVGTPYAQVTYRPPKEMDRPDRSNAMGQIEMFRSVPAMITGAYAHDSMRGTIPTLLGMAANRHRQYVADSTSLPHHDTSLSGDSSAMVQKLRSRGVDIPVNRQNPGAARTNEISDEEDARSHYVAGSPLDLKYQGGRNITEMSPNAVRRAGQTMRSVLRGDRRPTVNPHQFGVQQQLDLGGV